MVNKDKLKGKIVGSGNTQASFAPKVKMGKNTLNATINNKRPINADEIELFCDVLGISSNEEKIEIFLYKPSQ